MLINNIDEKFITKRITFQCTFPISEMCLTAWQRNELVKSFLLGTQEALKRTLARVAY